MFSIMKISKRQLKKIIREARRPYPAEALPTVSDALSDIYDGIDKLIQAVGPEEALRELIGIIDDWDETPYQGKPAK